MTTLAYNSKFLILSYAMNLIKKMLHAVLSQKQYLILLHRSFYLLYRLNLLKKDRKFKFHYLVRKLIQNDDTVIDIGANLGYFSKTFSRLTPNGKVICIEPLPQYYEVLNYFIGKRKNVSIHNVALGKENGEVTMVLPRSNGMIRTGLPYISKTPTESEHPTQKVAIVPPHTLFSELKKIDYIKCDVEGYEWIIFQEMQGLLEQHMPLVQIEISDENKEKLLDYFANLGYLQFGIKDHSFVEEHGEQQEAGDYLFVPTSKRDSFVKNNL